MKRAHEAGCRAAANGESRDSTPLAYRGNPDQVLWWRGWDAHHDERGRIVAAIETATTLDELRPVLLYLLERLKP